MNLYDSTSLASRLPTEVLCHVFVHSLPQIDHLLPKSKSSPMLLTSICRRWREVSVDMPSLWCRLSIEVDQTNLHQWFFCYDSWLKHTQGHPLSLETACIKNDTTCLRTLLQPYVHQVSSLNIMFDEALAPEIVFDDLPALQELRVAAREIDNPLYNTVLSISSSISRLSTLHTLEFEGTFFLTPDLISLLHPIWAHLTNLTIDSCELRDVMRLLQLTTNLSSFKVRVVQDDMNRRPLEPLTHTSIQSLTFTFGVGIRCGTLRRQPSFFDPLLTALTLPKLRVLNLAAGSWTGEELKILGIRDRHTRISCEDGHLFQV